MKRILITSLLAVALALGDPPKAQATTAMARADGSTSWTTTGFTIPYPVGIATKCKVQVQSAAGSTAIVQIEGSSTASGPWAVLATVTDPSVTGKYEGGGPPAFVRVNVTVINAGAINSNLEAVYGSQVLY